MSRGPGRLGRAIMAEIERAGGLASVDRLRERFPREVADKSFHRAVRSLERMGAVEVVDETGSILGNRVLVLNFGFSDGDKELVMQTAELRRWADWLARERGLPVPEAAPTDTEPSRVPDRINQRSMARARWTLRGQESANRPSDTGGPRGAHLRRSAPPQRDVPWA